MDPQQIYLTRLIVVSKANATVTVNGDCYLRTAGGAGAILYASLGVLEINGKISHLAGTNILSVWVAGGTFRWRNQSRTLTNVDSFSLHATSGLIDMSNLLLENYSRLVGLLSGTSTFSTGGLVITNHDDALAAMNFVDITVVEVEDAPPTLPAESKVQAGEVYGYAALPLTGTGLILDPATLAAAMTTTEVQANVTKISGDAIAADNLESMLDGTGGATLSLGRLSIVSASGVVGFEIQSDDAYPFSMWGRAYDANATQGFRYSPEESGLLALPNGGSFQVGTLSGDLSGKVLGGGASVIAGTGVQSQLTDGAISAGKFAANAVTSTVIAANAITSTKIATDAIGAAHVSAAAVTKIQNGLATSSALSTVSIDVMAIGTYVDTEIAQIITLANAIKAKSDQLVFTIANQVDANALTGGGGGAIDTGAIAEAVASTIGLMAIRQQLGNGPLLVDRVVTRGTTWRISLPFNVPAEWNRIEFTARSQGLNLQEASAVWVLVSNPDDAADGLQVSMGSAASDATEGTIVTEDLDSPMVLVQAPATATVQPGEYQYDAKVFVADEVTQRARGTLTVEADITRSFE